MHGETLDALETISPHWVSLRQDLWGGREWQGGHLCGVLKFIKMRLNKHHAELKLLTLNFKFLPHYYTSYSDLEYYFYKFCNYFMKSTIILYPICVCVRVKVFVTSVYKFKTYQHLCNPIKYFLTL